MTQNGGNQLLNQTQVHKISNSGLVGCFCIALLHNTLLKSIIILCSTWFEGSQYTIIIARLCRSWVRPPLMLTHYSSARLEQQISLLRVRVPSKAKGFCNSIGRVGS